MNTFLVALALFCCTNDELYDSATSFGGKLTVTAKYDHRLFPLMLGDVRVGWEYLDLTVLDVRMTGLQPGSWTEIWIDEAWSNDRLKGYADAAGVFARTVLAGPVNRGADCPHVAAIYIQDWFLAPPYRAPYTVSVYHWGLLDQWEPPFLWTRTYVKIACPRPCPGLPIP
jgi:hypothetical protein